MGVSRQAVSRWEQGEPVPSTENLIALGKLYGVSAEHLLNDNAPEPDLQTKIAIVENYPGGEHAKAILSKISIPKWAVIAAVPVVLVVATLVYIAGANRNNEENVSMDSMQKEESPNEAEGDVSFGFEW